MAKTASSRAMPKFTRAPEDLVRRFENALADFPMAERRKMFGYPSAFVNGQMFTGLFQDRWFVRLGEDARGDLITKFKTGLFEPMPGRPMREYVLVPPVIQKSPSRLRALLAQALANAQSLPPKKAARKKPV